MRLICILVFTTIITSCSNNHRIVEKHFEEGCWNIGDTLEFDFEPVSSTIDKFTVEVSFTEAYSYRNLYFKWLVISPSGQKMDFMRHQIMIDESGYWNIDPSGSNYVFKFPDSIRFEEKGIHKMKLFHYMREENLCDIERITIVEN